MTFIFHDVILFKVLLAQRNNPNNLLIYLIPSGLCSIDIRVNFNIILAGLKPIIPIPINLNMSMGWTIERCIYS